MCCSSTDAQADGGDRMPAMRQMLRSMLGRWRMASREYSADILMDPWPGGTTPPATARRCRGTANPEEENRGDGPIGRSRGRSQARPKQWTVRIVPNGGDRRYCRGELGGNLSTNEALGGNPSSQLRTSGAYQAPSGDAQCQDNRRQAPMLRKWSRSTIIQSSNLGIAQ